MGDPADQIEGVELLEEENLEQTIESENEPDEKEDDDLVENGDEEGDAGQGEGESEDYELSIDDEEIKKDEEEKQAAPAWVKELRKTSRQQAQEIKRLQRELEEKAKVKEPEQLKAKPKLEDFDLEKDYERELDSWYAEKHKFDAKKAQEEIAIQKEQEQWNKKIQAHFEKVKALPFKDVEEAGEILGSFISQENQARIIDIADDSAKVMYAIGKSPKLAERLAKINNPSLFIKEIVKLEAKVSIKKRSVSTQPERILRGSAPVTGAVDNTLERLTIEARKTGDRTKLNQYQEKLRRAKKR